MPDPFFNLVSKSTLCVLLILGPATATGADFLLPAEVPVGSTTGRAIDVFYRRSAGPQETVVVRADGPPGSCSFDVAELGTWGAASGNQVTYTFSASDPTGIWTLSCTGVSGSVRIRVVSSNPHGKMWFSPLSASSLASNYGSQGRQIVATDDAKYRNGLDPAVDDPWMIRRMGWYYILQVATPSYSRDSSGIGVSPVFGSAISNATPPTVSGAPNVAAGADSALERLALAMVVSKLSGDMTLDSDYDAATRYWTTSIATADWSGLNDLYTSRMLQSLAVAYDWSWEYLTHEERHVVMAALVTRAQAMYTNAEYDLAAGDDQRWDAFSGLDQMQRRVLTNGHTFERNVGLHIAALVLEPEMDDGGTATDEWIAWHDDTKETMDQVELEMIEDGSDHNGVYYWGQNVSAIWKYTKARDSMKSSTGAFVTPWMENNPRWVRHMTNPGGHRVLLGDGEFYDENGPGWQFATVADEAGDTLTKAHAQYMGLQGHTSSSYGGYQGRRDLYDILWLDDAVSEQTSTQHAAVHSHHCFADSGDISVRSSWGTDATHLVFRGGPNGSGHGDPHAGGFVIYSGGDMVITDGNNQVVKRTALGSTLLVDGQGQHGDFDNELEAVPEAGADGVANNAELLTYLDNKGSTWQSGYTLDLVTFGVDLRRLYVYSENDDDDRDTTAEPVWWVSDVESSGRSLDELSRYVVWVGDQVPSSAGASVAFVYDRWRTTGSNWRLDWQLAVGDVGYDEQRDAYRTQECSAESDANGYYKYTNSAGAFKYLRLLDNGGMDCTSTCPSLLDMNKGTWFPYVNPIPPPDKNTCTTDYLSVFSDVADVDPGGIDTAGWMQVRPQEANAGALAVRAIAKYDGGTLFGHNIQRTSTSGDGMFLTGIYLALDGGTPTTYTDGVSVTNGRKVTATMKHTTLSGTHNYRVVGYFHDPAASSTTITDGATNTVTGRIGLVAHKALFPTTRLGAQLIHGSKLIHESVTLIDVVDKTNTSLAIDSNIGVTYSTNTLRGTVQGISDGQVTTNRRVKLYAQSFTPSASVVVDWCGIDDPQCTAPSTLTATYSGNIVSFDMPNDGTFRVRSSSTVTTPGVASSCHVR